MSTETPPMEPQKPETSHYPAPLNVIVREWSVIRGAPLSFVVCLFICGSMVWLIVDRLYSGEIRAKDATIQTLSLRPESVPAQSKEIESLRSEVKALRENEARRLATEWPALPDSLASQWAEILAPFKIKSLLIYWNHGEGAQFYASLVRVFKDLNCKVLSGGGSSDPGQFVINFAADDKAGPVLLKLFNDAGYNAVADKDTKTLAERLKEDNGQIWIFLGPRL